MKKALIILGLLSASYASVWCMDGEWRNEFKNNNNQQPPPYQKPPAYNVDIEQGKFTIDESQPLIDNSNSMSINSDSNGSSSYSSAASAPLTNDLRWPSANDFYNGALYPPGTTTYGQFWKVHNIPEKKRFRSGPQLDEYLKEREQKWADEQRELVHEQRVECLFECAKCCGRTCDDYCCCVCTAGVLAGAITGLVYLSQYTGSCAYDPLQTKCLPDYFPGNGTLPIDDSSDYSNYTNTYSASMSASMSMINATLQKLHQD